jgi:hypothetical protein
MNDERHAIIRRERIAASEKNHESRQTAKNERIEKDFENTFEDSILVEQRTQNPFFRRMAIAVLRLLSPLM